MLIFSNAGISYADSPQDYECDYPVEEVLIAYSMDADELPPVMVQRKRERHVQSFSPIEMMGKRSWQ
jgi:hypothetical protein